jgi:hypothetical protein
MRVEKNALYKVKDRNKSCFNWYLNTDWLIVVDLGNDEDYFGP